MKKLTTRIAATASAVAVAGVAVLGAGDAASAATPASVHVQRPAVCINADDYRWDHGVSYLLEQGYSSHGVRGWHHDGRVTEPARYGCEGQFYRWDHGVSYLLEQGCSFDEVRGWHHDGRITEPARYGRDGHFDRWDGAGRGRKSDSSDRYHWSCYEHEVRVPGDR
ncbi:hypothetical protein [Streptomyces sp. NPDC005262]|uniref:hypothetical protein n=1 Tax=Streptomyces sp. NPDC005262 TaxID=3364710 RepID=UPI0036CBEDC1